MSKGGAASGVSRLLPEVLDSLDDGRELSIFDAGYANPDSLAWPTAARSRWCCAGLQDLLLANVGQQLDQSGWEALLRPRLRLPPGTCLDLCLFWDLPACMDDAALRALNRLLRPCISEKTRGHAFMLLKDGPAWPLRDYGIVNAETLSIHERQAVLPRQARPQARLPALLDNFRVAHGVLRSDGLLELSLLSLVPALPTH